MVNVPGSGTTAMRFTTAFLPLAAAFKRGLEKAAKGIRNTVAVLRIRACFNRADIGPPPRLKLAVSQMQ
jgi:hypothetical protein